MEHPVNTYHTHRSSKWLLVITLLLSAFAFTGYTGNTTPHLKQAVQIESIFVNNPISAKKSVSYNYSGKSTIHTTHFSLVHQYRINALLTFNRLVKIKLACLSTLVSSFEPPHRFIQAKTFPSDSGEDTHTS